MEIRRDSFSASDRPSRQINANEHAASDMTTQETIAGGQSGMAALKPLILVVDDDPAIMKLISHNLELAGYRVLTAGDGERAMWEIRDHKPSLVLLDVLLPGMDGFGVCKEIREFSDVPIMMITVKGTMEDVVRGLDMGADDYVAKPFDVNVLVARVKAVLSRTRPLPKLQRPPLVLGQLQIDFSNRSVSLGDQEVQLTHTEYRILCLLARNAGRMITKDYILTEVWGPEYHGDDHVLQVTIARLRKKIGDYQRNPRYIATRTGIGYMFMLTKPEEQEVTYPDTSGARPQAEAVASARR